MAGKKARPTRKKEPRTRTAPSSGERKGKSRDTRRRGLGAPVTTSLLHTAHFWSTRHGLHRCKEAPPLKLLQKQFALSVHIPKTFRLKPFRRPLARRQSRLSRRGHRQAARGTCRASRSHGRPAAEVQLGLLEHIQRGAGMLTEPSLPGTLISPPQKRQQPAVTLAGTQPGGKPSRGQRWGGSERLCLFALICNPPRLGGAPCTTLA